MHELEGQSTQATQPDQGHPVNLDVVRRGIKVAHLGLVRPKIQTVQIVISYNTSCAIIHCLNDYSDQIMLGHGVETYPEQIA
jgi:hypothetical protein